MARFSLEAAEPIGETHRRSDVNGSRRFISPEPVMKPLFDDIATVLVSLTLSLATVSLFIVVFAGAA
jgi:hypothetical protein